MKSGPCGTSCDVLGRAHMWSIITWKSHLSPRRITLRPRWHPPSPVKGPSIGNPPTFIGGARCTFVTWPNTEQDHRQCSSKDPAVKPLAGSRRNGHRPPGKRSSSASLLSGRLFFYKGYQLSSSWSEILDTRPVLYAGFDVLGRGRTTLSYVTGSVTTACCSSR